MYGQLSGQSYIVQKILIKYFSFFFFSTFIMRNLYISLKVQEDSSIMKYVYEFRDQKIFTNTAIFSMAVTRYAYIFMYIWYIFNVIIYDYIDIVIPKYIYFFKNPAISEHMI